MGQNRRPLTKEEQNKFRKKLEERKDMLWQKIFHSLEKHGLNITSLQEKKEKSEEIALSYLKESPYFSLLEPRIRELEDIEQALLRIKKGTYGRCIDCGKWLRVKRLEIVPWAARCRECKEKWEQLKALE